MSQVTASEMTKIQYSNKVKAATKGWDLLKKKCDSLKKKQQEIMTRLVELKRKIKDLFQQAFLAMAEAEWSAGNFHGALQAQVRDASFVLDVSYQNIAGVKLPIFIGRESEIESERISTTQGGS